MKYRVLDNRQPADRSVHWKLTDEKWDNSLFDNFGDAKVYAREWLGPQYEGNVDFFQIVPNVPVEYSGYGDTIEIREV